MTQTEEISSLLKKVRGIEFDMDAIKSLLSQDNASSNDVKTYESILIGIDGVFYLTDYNGHRLSKPAWIEPPPLKGLIFLPYMDKIYSINGKELQGIIGTKVRVQLGWLAQEVMGKTFISHIGSRGEEFYLEEVLAVSKFGYADLDSVTVYKDDKWRKYLFIDGYYEIEDFDIRLYPQDELYYMAKNGASRDLIMDIVNDAQRDFDVLSLIPDDDKAVTEMATRYFDIITECLGQDTDEQVAIRLNITLPEVLLVRSVLGSRTSFIEDAQLDADDVSQRMK